MLSLVLDIFSCFTLRLKLAFLFINAIFAEKVKWLKVLWLILMGKRTNLVEDRVQEYEFGTVMRYTAAIGVPVLVLLMYNLMLFWGWMCVLLLSSYIAKMIVEFIIITICCFPWGSVLLNSINQEIIPKVAKIEYMSQRESTFQFNLDLIQSPNDWQFNHLRKGLLASKYLKKIKTIILKIFNHREVRAG